MKSMKSMAIAFSIIILALNAVATEKLVITGSSTVAPLVAEMAKHFETQNKETRIDVQSGGSARGISDARQGVADIGMISRALKEDEKDLTSMAIARDGVGIIVHSSNQIKTLTDTQIVQIYTGVIKKWSEVGGADRPITVVNKAEGRSTLEMFLLYFKLKPTDVKASVVIGDNEQGVKTVAGNPSAIGYVSIGTAESSMSLGVKIKLLPTNGIAATTENVRNGTFPMSRPLTLVIKGKMDGLKRKFLDFAQSKDVQDLVKAQYFVPVKN